MNGILKGRGTYVDPYLIEDALDLNEIRNNIDSHFKLVNNIDMSSFNQSNVSGWVPVPTFRGTLNGNGFYIVNLVILNASTANQALIQNLSGNIKNLGLLNVNIVGSTNVSAFCVQTTSIVATLENCFVTGSIQGTQYVSSLAYKWQSPNIKNCFSWASLTATTGNIAGLVYELVGTETVLKNSYYAGKMAYPAGNANNKGTVFTLTSSASKENVFFDSSVAGIADTVDAVITTSMQSADFFAAKFTDKYSSGENIWVLVDGRYPILFYLAKAKYIIRTNNSFMTLQDGEWTVIKADDGQVPSDEEIAQYGLYKYEVSLIDRSKWNELRKYGSFEFISQVDKFKINEVSQEIEMTKYKDIYGATLYIAPLDIDKITENLSRIEIRL